MQPKAPDKMIGIVFTMLGNLVTGRYYRKVIQRVSEDFGAAKLLRLKYQTMLTLLRQLTVLCRLF
jgi:hypothetical protein